MGYFMYRIVKFIIVLKLCLSSPIIVSQNGNPLLFIDSDRLTVQGHLQFGINAVAETNLFWDLADVPEFDFDSDTQWLESYIKPGLSTIYILNQSSKIYTKISTVASSTLGVDAFDSRNEEGITLEEAHIGYAITTRDSLNIDLSVGSKELKLGTGMLIANGASSGFERGALKFGPRKAWDKAAILKISKKQFYNTLFFIEPNELSSNKTNNQLVGVDVGLHRSNDKFIGISYIKVLESEAPYPRAAANGDGPPIITPGDRKDLNAISTYLKSRPFKKINHLFTALDFSYQWNDRINMSSWGGRIQIGYDLYKTSWRPTIMYSLQIFSGDDPNTLQQERFDPLYFEGNPSSWSTGSKSSMVFINSNVLSHGVSLRLAPTKKDVLTFRYAHISAVELRSPIQFGQATRVDFSDDISSVISGVNSYNLADDLFLEYNRIINPFIFLNAGFSISFPGEGIRSIINTTSNWTGGFINIVFNY